MGIFNFFKKKQPDSENMITPTNSQLTNKQHNITEFNIYQNKDAIKQQVYRIITIFEESYDIINKTTDAETFFLRLNTIINLLKIFPQVDILSKEATLLIDIRKKINKIAGTRNELVNNLVDRKYIKLENKLKTMVQKNSMKANIESFCDDIYKHSGYLGFFDHEIKIKKLKKELLEKYIESPQNNLINAIHKDLELSIKNTTYMSDDDLLYDGDKIRKDTQNELSKLDFEKYRHYNLIKKIDLKPEEIVFMDYIGYKTMHDYNYPLLWYYKYNLKIANSITRLFEGGYIKFGDTRDKLYNLKVNELKSLLKDFGLKISGKKDELVSRLLENVDTEILNKFLTVDVFTLTDYGRDTVNNNKHIIYFHKKQLDISIYEADAVLKEHPGYNYYSIALHILNKRIESVSVDENSFNRYVPISYLYISYVYKDMGINTKELLYLLIYYCHCMGEKYFETPPTPIVDRINKIIDSAGLDVFEISEMINKILSDFSLKPSSKAYDNYINAIK